MSTKVKLVEYDLFCEKCEHEEIDSTTPPCDECLGVPVRDYSHTPINFEQQDKKKRKVDFNSA